VGARETEKAGDCSSPLRRYPNQPAEPNVPDVQMSIVPIT
jgi:hypothetical protein